MWKKYDMLVLNAHMLQMYKLKIFKNVCSLGILRHFETKSAGMLENRRVIKMQSSMWNPNFDGEVILFEGK